MDEGRITRPLACAPNGRLAAQITISSLKHRARWGVGAWDSSVASQPHESWQDEWLPTTVMAGMYTALDKAVTAPQGAAIRNVLLGNAVGRAYPLCLALVAYGEDALALFRAPLEAVRVMAAVGNPIARMMYPGLVVWRNTEEGVNV